MYACAVGFSQHGVNLVLRAFVTLSDKGNGGSGNEIGTRFLLLVVARHVCVDLLSWFERIKGPNVPSNNPCKHSLFLVSIERIYQALKTVFEHIS